MKPSRKNRLSKLKIQFLEERIEALELQNEEIMWRLNISPSFNADSLMSATLRRLDHFAKACGLSVNVDLLSQAFDEFERRHYYRFTSLEAVMKAGFSLEMYYLICELFPIQSCRDLSFYLKYFADR